LTDKLKEIGVRLAEMREVCEISADDMAAKLGMNTETYLAYESGKDDFPFSFLYNAADVLRVDVLDLLSGDSPTLSMCTVVRKDKGYAITRNKAYDYKHLAFTFRGKKMEPLLVTIDPSDKTPVLNVHEGQEFNYILSGSMQFYIGDISYELTEGDSVYFDSSFPHAQRAAGDKQMQFLAIVAGKTEEK
jgi:mannose-6-phosphate isomerase-like protein (cupin superfamily)/DNA-binding XRE family transcriptional regulator